MASNDEPPKYEDVVEPLEQVADIIPILNGNLATYAKLLEDLAKLIDEESSACDSPAIGFKINDLLSLVNQLSLKLSSYRRCCLDIAKFGADYEDKQLQSLNGMLSFIQEMSSFSTLLDKRVDAIISEKGKAMEALFELMNAMNYKPSKSPNQTTTHNMWTAAPANKELAKHTSSKVALERPQNVSDGDQQHFSSIGTEASASKESSKQSQEQLKNDGETKTSCKAVIVGIFNQLFVKTYTGVSKENTQMVALLEKCEKELNELETEAQRLKREVIAAYSRNIVQGLNSWSNTGETAELHERIMKTKVQCSKSIDM